MRTQRHLYVKWKLLAVRQPLLTLSSVTESMVNAMLAPTWLVCVTGRPVMRGPRALSIWASPDCSSIQTHPHKQNNLFCRCSATYFEEGRDVVVPSRDSLSSPASAAR